MTYSDSHCSVLACFAPSPLPSSPTTKRKPKLSIPWLRRRSPASIIDGDNAFRVAGSAAVEKVLVFPYWQHRRHRVDVRAQNHARPAGECEHVEAIRNEELLLHPVSTLMKQVRKEQSDFLLSAGQRGYRHELLRKFKHHMKRNHATTRALRSEWCDVEPKDRITLARQELSVSLYMTCSNA